MSEPDEVMDSISAAIVLQQSGELDTARERFAEIWDFVGLDGDPFHRCVLAHFMADVHDDPADRLVWDQRALDAAASLTDERAQRHHPSLAVRGFYPSLYLNLAQDYDLLGDSARAREHIELAKGVLHLLDEDGYGGGIRAAVSRLDDTISAKG